MKTLDSLLINVQKKKKTESFECWDWMLNYEIFTQII